MLIDWMAKIVDAENDQKKDYKVPTEAAVLKD